VGVAVDVDIIADDLTQRVDAFSKGAVDRQGIVKFRVGAAAIEKAVLAGIEAVAVVIPDDLACIVDSSRGGRRRQRRGINNIRISEAVVQKAAKP
jgi:hypothetical protein